MPSLPLKQLLYFYQDMLRIRAFEEQVRDVLAPQDLIRGSSHLYIGQEAVGVGAMHALDPKDYVLSSHRGHGHALAKGVDPRGMFAEILGRRTGQCKGKGGSMHITDMSLNFIGENPVVAAYFLGEGAINNGAFLEAVNMVALWKLPVIYICENNLYAISVPLEKSTADLPELEERFAGFGLHHSRLNGMDVEAVYFAVQEAAHVARNENAPTFLLCDTYRFEGHHLADLKTYRPRTEAIEEFRQRDPIHLLEKRILDDCLLSPDEVIDYRTRAQKEMTEACELAMKDPLPETQEALKDIYA